MALYQFKRTQTIQANLEDVWEFISNPANLRRITPEYMGFEIISKGLPQKMHAGMIIQYRVSPLLGISTNWVTEITQIDEGHYFVDEQRVGPYKLWHHQHFLEETDGGVRMTDIVSYQPPFGWLGRLANWLIIRSRLDQIFEYRREKLNQIFNKQNAGATPKSSPV